MIGKHFISIWKVTDKHHRRNILLKSLLFLFVCALPFLFKTTIVNYIAQLAVKYGFNKIKACCFFISSVLLCGFVYDFNKKRETVYPDAHFPVYQLCGLSAKQYKAVRIISCIPEVCVCAAFSYILCYPFLTDIIKKGAFLICYCAIAYILSNASVKNKQKRTIYLTGYIRSLFLKSRRGAVLSYCLFDKGIAVYLFLLICITVLSFLVSRSFFAAILVGSWFSIYIVPILINKHYRDSCFHQLYPQTFSRFIKDNLLFSAVCCLLVLLLAAALTAIGHGSYIHWMLAVFLIAPSTMLNHLYLYRFLAPHLPHKNPVDAYTPLISLLTFILIIPGISLLLILIQNHSINYQKPIFWGEKNNASS